MTGIARKEFSNDSSQTQVDSPSGNTSIEHRNDAKHSVYSTSQQSVDITTSIRRKRNARLANPLNGIGQDILRIRGENYARRHVSTEEEDVRAFGLGAILAQNPEHYNGIQGLAEEERAILRNELANKWHQPKEMYLVIALCSMCAATQGADESVVNGAQVFYSEHFGISGDGLKATWLQGLVNSGPYICCALLGCWLTIPFNHWFGRRGTILLTCTISAIACLWQAFVDSWWHLFIARFALGRFGSSIPYNACT